MSQRRSVAAKAAKDGLSTTTISPSSGNSVGSTVSGGGGALEPHAKLIKGPLSLDMGDISAAAVEAGGAGLGYPSSKMGNGGGASLDEMDPLSRDDEFQLQYHEARVNHWKENPFAVGLVERTWEDERKRGHKHRTSSFKFYGDDELNPDESGCLCCSAYICPLFGASRVGNMVVLRSSKEWVEEVTEDDESGETTIRRYSRPKLDCVVGPYWPMMCCITYPIIFSLSGWTFISKILAGKQPVMVNLVFCTLTIGLILALAFTACRDPGILYKYPQPPPQEGGSWRWSDRSFSYRPRTAFYDTDTAIVVDGFDHTCPWTGTAIGKKNFFAFQCFVCLVFVCMMMNIFILTGIFDQRLGRK